MEQSLVNGELPFSKYGPQTKVECKDLEEYQDKKFKSDYKDLQIQFADKLKYLSIKLKTLPVNDRSLFLRKTLEDHNKWIYENVRSKIETITTQSQYNFNGVILPFEIGDDQDPSVIMSIIPELAIPFDTKKRSPFKIVFETVKLSELR